MASYVLLASCASNTSNTANTNNTTYNSIKIGATDSVFEALGDEATPLGEHNLNLERAEHYLKLAASGNAENRVDAILSAAEHYIQANDFIRAEQTIQTIQTTHPTHRMANSSLQPIQQDRYDIVVAYSAYAQNDHIGALNQLNRVLSFDHALNFNDQIRLSTQQVDALLLSSFCHQALGSYDLAIEALLKREAGLSGEAQAETVRYTRQIINSMPIGQRKQIISSTGNVLLRNRLEQSLNGQFGQPGNQTQPLPQWHDDESQRLKQIISDGWDINSPKSIAILLPLTSRFNKASQALLDGIRYQDAENTSINRPLLRVYDIGEDPYQATQYYTTAIQTGADMVIGPLGKDYANQVGSLNGFNVPTILLGGDLPLSSNMVRFTMSPEAEGHTVAAKALRDGHTVAAILTPDNESSQRTTSAFSNYWLQHGGTISKTVGYSPQQFDHSVELKQLFDINRSEYRHRRLSKVLGFKPKFTAYKRPNIDFIFMVADYASGRLVRPQINFFGGSDIPVYSTSAIFNGIQDRTENLDLERTRFPVMPWFLKSINVAQYAGQLNALFAMGSDAYQIAGSYHHLRHNSILALNGNTGQLSVDINGEVMHQPVWANFIDGKAVATQASGIDISPLMSPEQEALEQRKYSDHKKRVYDASNWDSRRSRRKTGS